jgi:hypothetical protein
MYFLILNGVTFFRLSGRAGWRAAWGLILAVSLAGLVISSVLHSYQVKTAKQQRWAK